MRCYKEKDKEQRLEGKEQRLEGIWNKSHGRGKIITSEQSSPLCLTCGKSVQAKGSNTTNLWQHLREHHHSVYAEISSRRATKKGVSVA